MKRYAKAYAMCRSMFSTLPALWRGWEEDARGSMLLFLPLVGLELGALWALSGWAARQLGLPAAVQALILCLVPFITAGFIHLDGFMDVADALGSWRDPEGRREILKDSHVGSFAVIGVCMVLLSRFALLLAGSEGNLWLLVLIPAVSRCCSALAVTVLKPMKTSQYADHKKKTGHVVWLTALLCVCLGAGFLAFGWQGLVLLACVAGYGLALRRGCKGLAGMNGDISGYALTWGELAALAAWALL